MHIEKAHKVPGKKEPRITISETYISKRIIVQRQR